MKDPDHILSFRELVEKQEIFRDPLSEIIRRKMIDGRKRSNLADSQLLTKIHD